MAKRQTETKIWTTQRWYKKLHPYYKLAWKYLIDVCDHAGIWKIDYGQLIDDTGIENFNLADFMLACNEDFDPETGEKIFRERIKYVTKGVLWITGFVKFQYENKEFLINPEVPAIKSALQILNGYGILKEGLDKGYITLSKPFRCHQSQVNNSTRLVKPENQSIENQILNDDQKASEEIDNSSEPFNNPSITLQVGRVRTKDKDRDKDTLSKGYRDLEEVRKSNTEESKNDKKPLAIDNDVGLFWNAEEYFTSHQAIYEGLAMKYLFRYKLPEIKEILAKFHLWNVKEERYPQKAVQLMAGFELWLKNEKNIQHSGTAHQPNRSVSKSAGATQLIEQLGTELRTGRISNLSG